MTQLSTARLGSIACLLSLAATAAGSAEALNVKPGLWDMTTNTAMSGAMIPPALLERLTPEQRAHMEAAMKQHAPAGGAHANSTKSCLTKEDLQRGSVRSGQGEEQKGCQYRVVSQTATTMETHFQCTGSDARSGEMKLQAVSPEQIKGALQVSTTKGKVTMELTGRWLGPSCGATKD